MILHDKSESMVDPSKIEITIPPVGGEGGTDDLGKPPEFDLDQPPSFD